MDVSTPWNTYTMADSVSTIGERLQEARERKGISIREAAEATKIRGDFLSAMENNSFDIKLPEVYVRGFLKIYINYLRLDLDQYMADYDAMRRSGRKKHRFTTPDKFDATQTPSTHLSTPGERPSFGRMELDSRDAPLEQTAQQEPPPKVHLKGQSEEDEEQGLGSYMKPAIIAISSIIVISLIILIISSIWTGSKPEINPELVGGGNSATELTPVKAQRTITLIASDAVSIWVRRKSDGVRVFEGTLTPSETRDVDVDGPVEIRYSKGSALIVERDGKKWKMSASGPGRSTIQ